mgnify:CR=1 FL=1
MRSRRRVILTAILSVTTTLAELASVYENVEGIAGEFVSDSSARARYFPSSKFDDDLDERVVEAGRSAFGFGKRRSFKLAKLNGQDFILPLHLLIFPHWLTLTAV